MPGPVLAFASVALAAWASRALMGPVPPWYEACARPSFAPPSRVFPWVWGALFVLLGFAFARVLEGGDRTAARLFGAHLALLVAWSPLFFRMRRPWLALGALAGMAWTLARAGRRVPRIWPLLWPYAAWLAYAAVLNAASGIRMGRAIRCRTQTRSGVPT